MKDEKQCIYDAYVLAHFKFILSRIFSITCIHKKFQYHDIYLYMSKNSLSSLQVSSSG